MSRKSNVVHCKDCAKAMWDFGVGFMAETTLICSERETEVGEHDGCTFGVIGEGGYVVKDYQIDLCGDAAVGGSPLFEWGW